MKNEPKYFKDFKKKMRVCVFWTPPPNTHQETDNYDNVVLIPQS